MKLFPELRIVALLKRIAKALEDANELTRKRMEYDYPEWRKTDKPRKAEISVPTVEQWNERARNQDV